MILKLFSCNSKSNISQTVKKEVTESQLDTIVRVQVIPNEISGTNYIEKEYYIVLKKDTMNFSCIITKNKISGKMSIKYRYDVFENVPYSYSLQDTEAVDEQVKVKKIKHIHTYKEQIRFLELILNNASKDFNKSKVSSMSFTLRTFNEICQTVTKQYISKYGENFTNRSNGKIVAIIGNTSLIQDLNKILVPYSLSISKTSMDGLMYYTQDNSKAGTKPIIDGMIILNLVKTP